ncbi:dihydrodipicolinate reductase [Thermincola potens JR]|uniref:4-hydroxy-tetrahydrodipicolinate reductase n=1 Tax=Thermincola potens (strain JR) TaxID=635013 RepID=D5XF32_THEPJ|nr:dihydrodipicolinate reductase [Thermincola potens JR]
MVVNGACGRMGREVVEAVYREPDMELVGAIDIRNNGFDIGPLVGLEPTGVLVVRNLNKLLQETDVDVVVDFTGPDTVYKNMKTVLENKVNLVVGTTGILPEQLEEIKKIAEAQGLGVLIAPNFAIGAVLMMKFAAQAARYLPHVEIIELHHDQKLDAPSGTALKTAELIQQNRAVFRQGHINEYEKISGVRGGEFEGMRIHSIRLPGLIAHQEVIFGGLGQTLTIRHDSLNRESFMPGVILSIRKVMDMKGVIYGLENLITE